MKASVIAEMSDIELKAKQTELKGELFNLRFQLATGQLQNTMAIKECKRDIARVMTILRAREIAQRA